MFVIAAHADERQAHVREVERSGNSLPEGSYGRRNRQVIEREAPQVIALTFAPDQIRGERDVTSGQYDREAGE
jgi:regulator of extracellular matrix RemA (YlzA/DUF370 family)